MALSDKQIRAMQQGITGLGSAVGGYYMDKADKAEDDARYQAKLDEQREYTEAQNTAKTEEENDLYIERRDESRKYVKDEQVADQAKLDEAEQSKVIAEMVTNDLFGKENFSIDDVNKLMEKYTSMGMVKEDAADEIYQALLSSVDGIDQGDGVSIDQKDALGTNQMYSGLGTMAKPTDVVAARNKLEGRDITNKTALAQLKAQQEQTQGVVKAGESEKFINPTKANEYKDGIADYDLVHKAANDLIYDLSKGIPVTQEDVNAINKNLKEYGSEIVGNLETGLSLRANSKWKKQFRDKMRGKTSKETKKSEAPELLLSHKPGVAPTGNEGKKTPPPKKAPLKRQDALKAKAQSLTDEELSMAIPDLMKRLGKNIKGSGLTSLSSSMTGY